MIDIYLNQRDFEYDIYSLVKAFYPTHEVRIVKTLNEDLSDVMLRISVFYEKGAAGALSDKAGEKPADGTGKDPDNEACGKPADETGKDPDNEADGKPADGTGEAPGNEAGEKPANETGEYPVFVRVTIEQFQSLTQEPRDFSHERDAQITSPLQRVLNTRVEDEGSGGSQTRTKEASGGSQTRTKETSGGSQTCTKETSGRSQTRTEEAADAPGVPRQERGDVPDKTSGTGAEAEALRQEKSAVIYDFSDRLASKTTVKKLLYPMLCGFTGKTLPWGDLTGIRPARLVMNQLREGKTNAEIARFLREEYFVSPAKGALAIHIANRERAILDRIDPEQGYSLYVGIPFCPSICLYCSFSSSPIGLWKEQTDTYLDALIKEMRSCADVFEGKKLQTIYMGGGTPTTLSAGQLHRLLCAIEDCFDFSHLLEFTVEAGRPDSITRDKLQVLRDHGIGRISINPQTMNQATLDLIGRRHTTEQVKETFLMAREMGFDNINTDLIIGLPNEGYDEVLRTMEQIDALGPESVTVHALALKRAARLNLFKDQWQDISFHASTKIMDLTMERCEKRGLYPYYMYRQKNIAGNFENVGYAMEGRECLYNILIMEEVQSILALGAGASTKIVYPEGRIERVENVKDIRQYIDRIDEMIGRKKEINAADHGLLNSFAK